MPIEEHALRAICSPNAADGGMGGSGGLLKFRNPPIKEASPPVLAVAGAAAAGLAIETKATLNAAATVNDLYIIPSFTPQHERYARL